MDRRILLLLAESDNTIFNEEVTSAILETIHCKNFLLINYLPVHSMAPKNNVLAVETFLVADYDNHNFFKLSLFVQRKNTRLVLERDKSNKTGLRRGKYRLLLG